jgi:hypothetical protein
MSDQDHQLLYVRSRSTGVEQDQDEIKNSSKHNLMVEVGEQ